MRLVSIVAILLVAAAGATWYRYQSFSPCDWMVQDMTAESGLPTLVAEAQVKAHFLLQGITEPDPVECLLGWWDLRKDGPPPGS